MKTGVISSKSLIGDGYRIDPDVHLSEGVAIRRALLSLPYTLSTVGENADKVFLGNIFSRVYVKDQEHGIPYLAASDTVLANINTGKYLSKKQSNELSELLLEKDWILITCSGTLGNVTYTNSTFENHIATHDLIRVVPNSKYVNKETLYVFLSSQYGYYQITQSKFGGVVKHINDAQVKEILVPVFPAVVQDKIKYLIKESQELREKASAILSRAYSLFMSCNSLDIPKELLAREEKLTSNTRAINIHQMSTASLKAMNYSLRSERLIAILKDHNHRLMSEYLACPYKMGVRASFKRIDACYNGEDIISQSDIHKLHPTTFKRVRVKKESDNCRAKRGMLIMPSAGTLGESEVFTKPLLVRSNYEGKLLSEVIGTFECRDEYDAAYLYVFLSSQIGFRILRNMCCGTNLMYPMWHFMKDIPVPICDRSSFEEIASLTLEAFDCRGKANKLEDDALKLLDNEIKRWS